MKIKKFTKEGLIQWKNFYNELFLNIKNIARDKVGPKDIENGYNSTFKKKYKALLASDTHEDLSEDLDKSKNFTVKNYKNSYEMALSINNCLAEYSFKEIDVPEVWNWLAMQLFEQIFVPGKIRGASQYRYITEEDFFLSFRHLVRGPCWAVNQFGENAKIFTCTETYVQNDFLEQFIKISHLRENKAMGEVVMKLYYDYKRDRAMEGTSKYPGKNLTKPGIFPRLRDKTYQFNRVMYLWGMSADEIIKMLPKEFNTYKKNITL
jgi:hypothetical protein